MDTPDRPSAPTFSRQALRELDQRCVEEFGIPSILLMENAAIGMCDHTLAFMREHRSMGVLILTGAGNNGGDGLALARHLHTAGVPVQILMLREPRPGTDAGTQHDICTKMGLPISALQDPADAAPAIRDRLSELAPSPVLVDALLGTGLDRDVTGAGDPLIAADLPSGMDADSGKPRGACVRAGLTCTFAGLKRGFASPEARALTGRIQLCPIGATPQLVQRVREPG